MEDKKVLEGGVSRRILGVAYGSGLVNFFFRVFFGFFRVVEVMR